MSWLLRWAGLKELRPWWDQWLLLVTALVAIAGWMSLYFFNIEIDIKLRWLVLLVGVASLYGLVYLGSRKLERFELKRTIEKNRPIYSSE